MSPLSDGGNFSSHDKWDVSIDTNWPIIMTQDHLSTRTQWEMWSENPGGWRERREKEDDWGRDEKPGRKELHSAVGQAEQGQRFMAECIFAV